jgi:hypothetical protein
VTQAYIASIHSTAFAAAAAAGRHSPSHHATAVPSLYATACQDGAASAEQPKLRCCAFLFLLLLRTLTADPAPASQPLFREMLMNRAAATIAAATAALCVPSASPCILHTKVRSNRQPASCQLAAQPLLHHNLPDCAAHGPTSPASNSAAAGTQLVTCTQVKAAGRRMEQSHLHPVTPVCMLCNCQMRRRTPGHR